MSTLQMKTPKQKAACHSHSNRRRGSHGQSTVWLLRVSQSAPGQLSKDSHQRPRGPWVATLAPLLTTTWSCSHTVLRWSLGFFNCKTGAVMVTTSGLWPRWSKEKNSTYLTARLWGISRKNSAQGQKLAPKHYCHLLNKNINNYNEHRNKPYWTNVDTTETNLKYFTLCWLKILISFF